MMTHIICIMSITTTVHQNSGHMSNNFLIEFLKNNNNNKTRKEVNIIKKVILNDVQNFIL